MPAWLGAGSLLLAFRIFLRDRSRADREQVDKVGVWWTCEAESDDLIKVQWYFRNGTELPLQIRTVSWRHRVEWRVPWVDPVGEREGTIPMKAVTLPQPFAHSHHRLAPQETLSVVPYSLWLEEPPPDVPDYRWLEKPQPDATVSTRDGISCVIDYMLVVDNAGRRWEVRPERGGPAMRVRWYSWRGRFYPTDWLPQPWRGIRQRRVALRIRRRRQLASRDVAARPDGV